MTVIKNAEHFAQFGEPFYSVAKTLFAEAEKQMDAQAKLPERMVAALAKEYGEGNPQVDAVAHAIVAVNTAMVGMTSIMVQGGAPKEMAEIVEQLWADATAKVCSVMCFLLEEDETRRKKVTATAMVLLEDAAEESKKLAKIELKVSGLAQLAIAMKKKS